jgi:hypothetical protein
MAFVSLARATRKSKFVKAAAAGNKRGPSKVIRQAACEAKGTHTWAKYAPGAPRVKGNLKIDVASAKTNKLALT